MNNDSFNQQLTWHRVMIDILRNENRMSEYEYIYCCGREESEKKMLRSMMKLLKLKGYVIKSYNGSGDEYRVTEKGLDALEGVEGFTWTSLIEYPIADLDEFMN